jgi:hypothetical protein
MAVVEGKGFRLWVSATEAGTFVLVKDMNAYENTSDAPTEDTAVFDRAVAYSGPGVPVESFTIDGLLNPTDPGQEILRAARKDRTSVWARILPDGTNGYVQEFRVGARRHGAGAGAGFQTHGFTLSAVGDQAPYPDVTDGYEI